MTKADLYEILKIALSGLTLASIIIAYLGYRVSRSKQNEDRVRERDKELLAQAQKSMQWAYDVLTANGSNIPPLPDRLNWLTAARHLLRGQKIAQQISGETYKTVYAELEEYWRHKFSLALADPCFLHESYYSRPEGSMWHENIEISSALVVVDFSKWRKTAVDPIDEVDRSDYIKNRSVLAGHAGRGLEAYMARLGKIRGESILQQSTEVL